MSGESKITFGSITEVTLIKIEFSVSFVSEILGVQVEILGCKECNNLLNFFFNPLNKNINNFVLFVLRRKPYDNS
jgi:hypothetical protein